MPSKHNGGYEFVNIQRNERRDERGSEESMVSFVSFAMKQPHRELSGCTLSRVLLQFVICISTTDIMSYPESNIQRRRKKNIEYSKKKTKKKKKKKRNEPMRPAAVAQGAHRGPMVRGSSWRVLHLRRDAARLRLHSSTDDGSTKPTRKTRMHPSAA
jgi:hypothetical protein